MKIATQTERLGIRLGDETAVRIICESGFDAIDYSMFKISDDNHIINSDSMKSYVLGLRAVAESYGVYFCQSHAPFPSMKPNDEAFNKRAFSHIVRAMEVSALLGVEIMVVHPVSYENVPLEVNVSFYNSLIPYIEKYGVQVATENMWGHKNGRYIPLACSTAESFCELMNALDPQHFVACLDIGHCGMVGQKPADMIRALGNKHLHALHVHDNDNLRDAHIFPFSGTVNWAETMQALSDINYDGYLTFEADNSLISSPESFLPEQMKYLHGIGKALAGMVK